MRCCRPRLLGKAKVEAEKTMVVVRRGWRIGWNWKEREGANASHAAAAALGVVLLLRWLWWCGVGVKKEEKQDGGVRIQEDMTTMWVCCGPACFEKRKKGKGRGAE